MTSSNSEDLKANRREHDKLYLRINHRKMILILLVSCLTIELGFVICDAIINYGRLTTMSSVRHFFNIAREDSLATWFGVTQTFMVGLTLWFIYWIARNLKYEKWRRIGWLILAVFFTYMAMDDGSEFHEMAGSLFRDIFKNKSETLPGQFPGYAWQILFLPLFGGMGIFMLIFLRRELTKRYTLILFGVAISCYVMAVGLDFFEGLAKSHPLNIYTAIKQACNLSDYTVDHFAKSLEEFLEMAGTTFFWITFLHYLAGMSDEIRIKFIR